jgi:NADH-quinone oxidoreductase subunit J
VPLDNVVFWVFAPISVASAVAMLLMRNAVHAALFLVVNFFCLAVFYLILDAPFLFAVQIIVYAGAIMVLFVFVVMLLDLRVEETAPGGRIQSALAGLGGLLLVAVLWIAMWGRSSASNSYTGGFWAGFGTVEDVGRLLFGEYVFAFEAASVLLVVAMIGAVILARREQ